jgi:hypothetical protein
MLGAVPPGEAITLLRGRLERLEAATSARRAALARALVEVPRLFLVEEEYRLALQQAEVGWVRGLLHELESGSLPGLAEWRAYHAEEPASPEGVAETSG